MIDLSLTACLGPTPCDQANELRILHSVQGRSPQRRHSDMSRPIWDAISRVTNASRRSMDFEGGARGSFDMMYRTYQTNLISARVDFFRPPTSIVLARAFKGSCQPLVPAFSQMYAGPNASKRYRIYHCYKLDPVASQHDASQEGLAAPFLSPFDTARLSDIPKVAPVGCKI